MLLQVFNAMLRPMEGSVMTATTAVGSEDWSEHVALVFARLDERQQRWVGGLLSALLGRGGTKQIAALAGLDPQTIRQGSIDLQRHLEDSPDDGRARRPGGGRPPLKNKIHHRPGSERPGGTGNRWRSRRARQIHTQQFTLTRPKAGTRLDENGRTLC